MIKGARQHNLRNLDVRFPLGVVTAVTGVSGSGKSSLVEDILWKAAARALHRAQLTPGAHEAIEGLEQINKVISVDQTPLGSTPSSTPGDLCRRLRPDPRALRQAPRGQGAGLLGAPVQLQPGRRPVRGLRGGRAETDRDALPARCLDHLRRLRRRPVHGRDAGRHSSTARRSPTCSNMSVAAALELFANVPRIRKILQTLYDVGLGYISLGQAAPTLSGGEAQRVKLAAELARPDTGKTLYILDEPTTGLHFDDVRKLLDVIHRLADLGNTVVVIEHNLEVIKTADWVIDLGPEAGVGGRRPGRRGNARGDRQGPAQPHRQVPEAGARRRPAAERPRFEPSRRERNEENAGERSGLGRRDSDASHEETKGRR